MGKRKIWTDDNLELMRSILKSEKRVDAAISRAKSEIASSFDRRTLLRQYKAKFGESMKGTCGKRSGSINKEPDAPEPKESQDTEHKITLLETKVKTLAEELRKARHVSQTSALIRELLYRASEPPRTAAPDWAGAPEPLHGKHGTPTLMISDIHHGGVITPAQVEFCNEFDVEISRNRIKTVFERTCSLLDEVLANPTYPGIICVLGGDLVNGNIHDELRQTNELGVFDAVIDCSDHLISGIKLLKKRYKRVFVPCVVGNHGRLDKKPRAKNGVEDNFEYILYHRIGSYFANDPDVCVVVPDSFSYRYRVHNTRYLLLHGDSMRGGAGIAGPMTPWALADHKLRKQGQSMAKWSGNDLEHDMLIFGHFHTFWPSPTFIANGSICGMDEYAKKCGFSYQPPIQALWLTNPRFGVTFTIPVYADDAHSKTDDPSSWVEFAPAKHVF